MKTSKIVMNVAQKIRNCKIQKKEAEINKYLSYEFIDNSEIKQEIYEAREILANYAKANNVRIALFTTPKKMNSLELSVTPFSSFDSLHKTIPTTKEPLVVREKIEYTSVGKDGSIEKREMYNSYEDNLLRRIYRAVEQLTNRTKTEYVEVKRQWNPTRFIGRLLDK